MGRGILCFLTASVWASLPYDATAETFDFDGSAAVSCKCPSPTMAGNCAFAGRTDWAFNVSIAVKKKLEIDLGEVCRRKREIVCCETPRERFSGTIMRKCPGRASC